MDFENLKKARTSTKSSITRIETWFQNNKDLSAESTADVVEFEIRLGRLHVIFENYEREQNNIELLVSLENPDTEDRSIMEDKYFSLVSGITKCIQSLSKSQSPTPSESKNSHPGSQASNNNLPPISVKLPDIKIQVFAGDVREFESFFQLFDALIINNSQLTNIQRFIYLKGYLKGEPLHLIDSLNLTHDNFDIALGILKSRYENKIVIINSYLAAMLEAPSINKCKSNSLREFTTTIHKNCQSLKNLNLSFEELWNALLVFLFQKKLDFNTKRAFETERNHSEIPTLEYFLNFLEKRCTILESMDLSSPKTQRKNISVNHTTASDYGNIKGTQSQTCVFCHKSGHRIYSCFAFKNISHQEKSKFVKVNRLCFNCLGKHNLEKCSSSQKCSLCSKPHNTLLHFNKEIEEQQSRNNSPNNTTHRPAVSSRNNPQTQHSSQPRFQPNSSNHIPRNNSEFSTQNEPSIVSFSGEVSGVNSRGSNSENNIKLSNSSSHSALSIKNSHILLATVEVILYSKQGEPIQVKALLDTGTQISLITQKLVTKLKCNTYDVSMNISGISQSTTMANRMADVEIYSNSDQNKMFKVSCALLPNLTCKLPQYKIMVNRLDIPKDIILADSTFFEPSEIDIIIGLDIYYDIIMNNIVKLGKNLPVLQESHFGWIIAGVLPKKFTVSHFCQTNNFSNTSVEDNSSYCSFLSTAKVDKFLQNFWHVEDVPEHPLEKVYLSEDEKLSEQIFSSTTKILTNGRFQVNIPVKSISEVDKLGDSFTACKKRLNTLENRFRKDNNLFQEYSKFIDEYVDLGHAQYIPLSLKNYKLQNKYFIPHLCVIRESSVSTKLRVVYDASCVSSSGYSLNDICLKGYQVQADLYDILCRFRLFPFVFTTDIKKMYRQILINPEQRFLQNILWRENSNTELRCIQLNTVTYGTNSAPFMATRVLKEIATLNSKNFPLASEIISSQFYMDDGLCGAHDRDTLINLHSQLTTLLNKHGFQLHKYCSNDEIFLQAVGEQPTSMSYDINPDDTPNKVLGLKWNPTTDNLCISVPEKIESGPVTKRKILSIVAQCYDPLGLINAIIVKGKILIQKLWIKKLDWDTVITDPDILTEFNNFVNNLPLLATLKIPRFYFENKNISKIELHGFADASLSCYGCCIYFRAIYDDGTISSTLISSKSRIAPVKSITLPRLELCAMLLLSKLVHKMIYIFKKLSFHSVNLWTDSQVALCWCKGHPSRWTVFVAHRVSQIQALTNNYTWRHVRSADNAADIVSRGIFPYDILKNELWWQGPKFLMDSDLDLSTEDQPINIPEIPEERKSHILTNIIESTFWEDFVQRFSSFSRLQRCLAVMFRFIKNIKTIKENRDVSPISVQELEFSLEFIVKETQSLSFKKEISELTSNKPLSNKQLLHLKSFLDNSGLLRVGGRLDHANISYQQKHPLVLPSKNSITNLILTYEHRRLGHAGAQTTLSNVRLKFWPLNGLRDIKRIIRNCTTCFRFNNHTAQQIMASLPLDRVDICRPFYKVGVDFGGPFLIKASSLRKSPQMKVYIAVFVCMVTKAIHIEVVTGLSTDLFLLTLKRFTSRRGNPKIIFSDNATNFCGARNHLRELYIFFQNQENSSTINEFLSQNQTTWQFIPPRSPHWGGLWESAIKGAKYHMKRLIGNANLTLEEFSTILCQIEAILNSRPLSPISNDASDFSCLTPGHFLIGEPLTAYPDRDVTSLPQNRLSFYQRISQIQQSFWKRWSVEYLNRLQNRPKWLREKDNLKENDLVLLKDDDVPPLKWPLARVVEAIAGKDGKVRVAKIKTLHGIFTRPITKLCLLPNQTSSN